MNGIKKILIFILTAVFVFSAVIPFASYANAELDEKIEAEAFIVTDATTGQILYAKNHEKAEIPANLTKIMTAAIALEELDLQKEVTVNDSAINSAVVPRDTMNISLVEGEKITVEALLYAALIQSANDAANVLAEAVGGSIESFVKKMNEKAAAIGCENTSFFNASGLTSDSGQNNVTTAYDMALIMRYAMKNAYFKQIIKQTTYTVPETNKSAARELSTSHNLLKKNEYYEYATGGTVGYSKTAKYTAATSALNGERELICIVLNCPTGEGRFTDTRTLFDYVFSNFEYTTLTQDDINSKTVDVISEDGTQIIARATLTLPGAITVLLHKDVPRESLIITDTVPESFTAEATNQSVTVSANSDLMFSPLATSYLQASTDILATPEPVPTGDELTEESKNSFGSIVLTVLKVLGIIILVIIVGIIILAVYSVIANNKRRKKRRELRRREARGEDGVSERDGTESRRRTDNNRRTASGRRK